MTTTTEETQSIVVEHQLSFPPEKVWRALTESSLVTAWLMPNDLVPVKGHRFTFQSRPIPGWDGVCHCEVLEVEPTQKLSYTWRGGSDEATHYGTRLDTVVTWTLTRTDAGGTLLRLVHSGFTAKNAHAFEIMSKGWHGMVTKSLAAVIQEPR
jgi:uncharacterized protein YndB with AHSA1/START domain